MVPLNLSYYKPDFCYMLYLATWVHLHRMQYRTLFQLSNFCCFLEIMTGGFRFLNSEMDIHTKYSIPFKHTRTNMRSLYALSLTCTHAMQSTPIPKI